MARFRVIRESTRSRTAEPFVEVGWWILDDHGSLSYETLVPTQAAQNTAWMTRAREQGGVSDQAIFDYLDTYGGDGYFLMLGIPSVMESATLDTLVGELKAAQNMRPR